MRLLALVLLLFTSIATASEGFVQRYTYTKVGNKVAITAPWSTWDTFIAAFGGTASRKPISILEFDFVTPDYFTPENRGHFSVGIGYANAVGEDQGLFGHGLVIGSVYGYPYKSDKCGPSYGPNLIAIESYFGLDNCVYGPTTASPQLSNNVWYHLRLEVDNQKETIRYVISERDTGNLIDDVTVRDVHFYNEHYDYAGWWFAEAFAKHDWVIVLENIKWDL